MNTLLSLRRSFIVVMAVAAVAFLPSVRAVEAAKALPVTTSFEKGEPGEHGGPNVMVVKNTSAGALKIRGTIVQSVSSHNRPRTIELPEHTLEGNGTWKISDLAFDDKVTLVSEGYDKLEVKVPATKK
jgi:hypothetical protein